MAAQTVVRKLARNLVTKAMAIVTTITTTVAVTGTLETAAATKITIIAANASALTASTKAKLINVRRISRVSAKNQVGKVTTTVTT